MRIRHLFELQDFGAAKLTNDDRLQNLSSYVVFRLQAEVRVRASILPAEAGSHAIDLFTSSSARKISDYSSRSARIGLTLTARRAGTHVATSATS